MLAFLGSSLFIFALIISALTLAWGQVTPKQTMFTNCGLTLNVETPPTKAVTLNQAATEVMLALGLEDVMVGTAYLDDEILAEYKTFYEQIPVLAREYPSKEALFAVEPDFIYGSYASAFAQEVAGSREELIASGVTPYLSPFACEDEALRATNGLEAVFQELREVATMFGVPERAEALIGTMQADLEQVQDVTGEQEGMRVLWFDSGKDDPFVGACCGAPALIMKYLNVENIFADTQGSWATVSWEAVLERDPEVIIFADASWDSADERMEFLTQDSRFSTLTAVKEQRFISIPFSYTTPGIRNVAAVRLLAEALYPELFQ
ncbi:MAG: ABC transporter substrate-binding protein [Trueperaceae bacterium]